MERIVDPIAAFANWERALEQWVRESVRAFVLIHQARGELLEAGFSGGAVAVDELALLLLPYSAPDNTTVSAARDARTAMWRALDECDAALEGRLLWSHIRRCFGLADDELELLLLAYVAGTVPSLQRALRFAWNDFGRKLPTATFLWELARPERGESGLDRLTDIVHLSNLVTYQLVETLEPFPSPVFAQLRIHPHVAAVLGNVGRVSLGAVRRVTLSQASAETESDSDEATPVGRNPATVRGPDSGNEISVG